ncbi:hypothetical protein JOC85_002653 [Bacillus mesophilus]|uniref:Uncharacterized protein n=1 Tax=Bacillus mesophilus TaxID=1808955 RepID=A0A6M0Q8U1_9BACI|nr:DUF6526 family protein [Bacillus mesophilus]MBM7661846.1 hypothetical protein [Bacillus mesophilus]NEY72791.1 hypothetical protein [Bacillus mesophilus]
MEQNYKKHAMIDPLFHYVLAPLALLTVILGIIQIVNGFSISSLLLFVGAVLFFLIIAKLRLYALKLQDRIIRSEENFRYYVLTGKRLDSRITMKQLIALRFASDEEFPSMVEKAVNDNLTPNQIKQLVENWRGDYHRV